MIDIGKILREKRNDQNLSLQTAEEETKIAAQHLRFLELNSFERLPGPVYVVGYLRVYGRYLGLDAEELVNAYKAQHMPADAVPPSAKKRKKWPLVVLALVLVLAVALGVAYWQGWIFTYNLPATVDVDPDPGITTPMLPENTDPQEEEDPDPLPETQPQTETELEPQPLQILVEAANARCWIKAEGSSGVLAERTLAKGQSVELSDPEFLKIRFGDALAVRLTINGVVQEEPLGGDGEVLTKTFLAEDYR